MPRHGHVPGVIHIARHRQEMPSHAGQVDFQSIFPTIDVEVLHIVGIALRHDEVQVQAMPGRGILHMRLREQGQDRLRRI